MQCGKKALWKAVAYIADINRNAYYLRLHANVADKSASHYQHATRAEEINGHELQASPVGGGKPICSVHVGLSSRAQVH